MCAWSVFKRLHNNTDLDYKVDRGGSKKGAAAMKKTTAVLLGIHPVVIKTDTAI